MDTVQAPGTAWAHGDGMKERGESLEVSGRGLVRPEALSRSMQFFAKSRVWHCLIVADQVLLYVFFSTLQQFLLAPFNT